VDDAAIAHEPAAFRDCVNRAEGVYAVLQRHSWSGLFDKSDDIVEGAAQHAREGALRPWAIA
jgi:hypothetical protein